MSLANLLARFTGKPVVLSDDHRNRLHVINQLPSPDLAQAPGNMRWVVADVETSGLNTRTDRLIAVGAVAIVNSEIQIADSLEVVLRQPKVSSHENILIHRIAGDDQRAGEDPQETLLQFLEFVGDSPLVGFHAAFDEIMLARAIQEFLGITHRSRWLDLAALAPALVPEPAAGAGRGNGRTQAHSLDWWLDRYAIKVTKRHNAAADAFFTAQLFGVLLSHAKIKGLSRAGEILKLAEDYAWLSSRQQT